MDVETTLKKFITESFGARLGGKELGNGDPLLDTGVVDSVGIFELVGFLQATFDVDIQDMEIVPEHFESIDSLAAFVRSKQGR